MVVFLIALALACLAAGLGTKIGFVLARRIDAPVNAANLARAASEAAAAATAVPAVKVNYDYIMSYEFPTGMTERALSRCPANTSAADAEAGLRQFLYAAGDAMRLGTGAGMPSPIVDELWHEFMVYTSSYAEFCSKAYRRFLHHEPEVTMTAAGVTENRTSAMVRTWDGACRAAGLSPTETTVAPELFRIDAEMGMCGAKSYVADCGVTGKCKTKRRTVCVKHELRGVSQEVPKPAKKVETTKASAKTGSSSKSSSKSSGSSTSGRDSGYDSSTLFIAASVSDSSSSHSSHSSCGSSSHSSSGCGSSSSSCGSSSSSCGSSGCGGF